VSKVESATEKRQRGEGRTEDTWRYVGANMERSKGKKRG
jgi:hypothetical protein